MAAAKSSLASANKQLVMRQAALKKAEAHLASQQKALTGPAAELQRAHNFEKKLKENLKFWQAAKVNARAIVITEKRDSLKAQQEQETSALESKTRERGNSQSDLNSLENRKEALIGQLKELNAEMASLKQSIADRKPLLEEAERESKDLQKRYLELSAEVAAGTDPGDSDSDDDLVVTKVTKAPKVDQEKVYNAFMKENSLVAVPDHRMSVGTVILMLSIIRGSIYCNRP